MPDQLDNLISKENLSAVLYKAGDLRLEKTPLPDKPGKNGEPNLNLFTFLQEHENFSLSTLSIIPTNCV